MSNGRPILGYFLFGLSAALAALGAVGAGDGFAERIPGPAPVVVPFVLWQLAVWAFLMGHFVLRRHARRARARAADVRASGQQGVETP